MMLHQTLGKAIQVLFYLVVLSTKYCSVHTSQFQLKLASMSFYHLVDD